MTIIDKKKLYGDEYKAVFLCEFRRETKLIKQFIDICEDAWKNHIVKEKWGFDWVCDCFAETIIKYSKIAFDNLILGHFSAVNIINRTILENCVLLDILINNDELELWKYYIVHSYRDSIYKLRRNPSSRELKRLEEMYSEYNISEDFYIRQGDNKKAYIEKNYGWTYKINKDFSFAGVCKFVDEISYKCFRMMSEYTHSTSLYTKLDGSVLVEQIMNMYTGLYVELYKMVTLYCYNTAGDEFDTVAEKLENIFYDFIYYEEALYKTNES